MYDTGEHTVARRACYAALEMQRSVAAYAAELTDAEGIELALRVGVNSGEVIVGDIATATYLCHPGANCSARGGVLEAGAGRLRLLRSAPSGR